MPEDMDYRNIISLTIHSPERAECETFEAEDILGKKAFELYTRPPTVAKITLIEPKGLCM